MATGPPYNATLFFRGARVRLAQQEYLRAAGLGGATEIVIAGCRCVLVGGRGGLRPTPSSWSVSAAQAPLEKTMHAILSSAPLCLSSALITRPPPPPLLSAGGLSVYLHTDKWAAAFPSARVSGLADSGFFLNYDHTTGAPAGGAPGSPTFPSNTSYPWRMWWMASVANVTDALNARCLAAQAPGAEWLCLFAEATAPFLTSPVFALQSYHDSYQVSAILDAPGNATAINAFGLLLSARLKATLLASAVPHGAALDACFHHCGSSGTTWPAIPFTKNTTVQNQAWAKWYTAHGSAGERLWEQIADWPCKWCCGARVTEAMGAVGSFLGSP